MTELDETVCPACGKSMRHVHVPTAGATYETIDSIWAVAHYLAHLVQQNQPPSFGVMHGPDDPPDEPR